MLNLPQLDIEKYLSSSFKFILNSFPDLIHILKSIFGFVIGISIPVSLMLFIGIIYCVERLKEIRRYEERELYGPPEEKKDEVVEDTKADKVMAERWDRVTKYVESDNENDLRQAILEADVMLGDLLNKLGYRGQGIGEQLKRANKGDFKTLDDAWEAHKIRNEIAHSGSEYKFTQLEARRVIAMYRKVFEEFFHI